MDDTPPYRFEPGIFHVYIGVYFPNILEIYQTRGQNIPETSQSGWLWSGGRTTCHTNFPKIFKYSDYWV